MARVTLKQLAETIDDMGALKAQMADLKELENDYRKVIIDSGKTAFEGEMFRATVSESYPVKTDLKAILAALVERKLVAIETINTLTEEFTTKATEPIVTVKIVARRATVRVTSRLQPAEG